MAKELNSLDIIKEGFKNTLDFSPAAQRFLKSGDHDDNRTYCTAPVGTSTYKDFWDEEEKRCILGYTVNDIAITGIHYFYLNYCRIKIRIKDTVTGLERRMYSFPRFLDIDYYYFHEIQKARNEGQGQIIAKSRRKGFSFKNGAICAWSFTFERDSTSLIGAYLEKYATQTMNMSIEILDFNLKHSDFGKNRIIDTKGYIESGFIEDGIKQGFKSVIERLTFKDNFSSAIGKGADWMLFEEAGKWQNLIESHTVTAPVFKDGAIRTGTDILFGTGGDMEGGSIDFSHMFYDPKTFDLRPYNNIWDDGAEGTNCGLFIDDMWYKPGVVLIPKDYEFDKFAKAPPHEEIEEFKRKHREDMVFVDGVDDEGNSHRLAAEINLNAIRAEKRKNATRKAWEGVITQYPKTPKEAFLISSGNLFPTAELNSWLGKLETSGKFRDSRQVGYLFFEQEKVKWQPDNSRFPVDKFPHKAEEDNTGCIIIWEHPYKDFTGAIPFGLYIAGTDPYDQDTSGTSSLGSTFVYKQYQKFDETFNIIVAEYTGRPDTSKDYYENVRKLLLYYNAQCLYENQLTGMKVYFEQKKSLNLLKEQPEIIKNIVKHSVVNRGYGIHMSEPIKRQAEIYLRDWLLEERTADEDGNKLLNLHTIMSIPLLKELITYNPKDGNFDRVIALMLIMLHHQENHNIEIKKKANSFNKFSNGIFDPKRVLFKKNR